MADSTRVDVPVRGREVQRRRALAVRLALPHRVDVRAALHERRHLPVHLRCVRWERNLKNGVCAAEFDRRDIAMNKCAVATLEGKFHVFDMRTHNKERGGYAGVEEKFPTGATLWGCTHLPQNRDLWMVGGGDGTVSLYKYAYPDQRRATDADGKEYGVTGEVRCLTYRQLSTQPINCWDWSADKEGLAVCGSFDQSVRVVICSRLSRQ